MNRKSYHIIVIGAGSGGLVAAAGAAGLGAKVALIEKSKMGGDCLNTGCVPSKAIIRAAKVANDMKTAGRFGLDPVTPSIDLARIMSSVDEARERLAHHDAQQRFEGLGVDVYREAFRFTAPNEISNGTETLRAKRFVIATGSRPAVPDVKGIDSCPVVTSENIWGLSVLPKRFIVLGGGPIGAELAQVFSRLGSQVTIVQRGKHLLKREDTEVADFLAEVFRREGIEVLTGCHVESIDTSQSESLINLLTGDNERKSIPFDRLLVSVGRSPNVSELDLEKAGVSYSTKGIQVDDHLRTTNKNIYACGDVAGPYLFTHTADFQARLILRNALFPGKSKINYRVVTWCTFTDPEVARVGLSETEAQQQNVPYDLYRYSLKDLDRAVCDREDEGFIKVLTRNGSDELLGVTLVGSHAGDVLHELQLALHQKIGLKKVASMIHIYPTLAEVSKRIADTFQRSRLTDRTRGWLKRYFRWRFG